MEKILEETSELSLEDLEIMLEILNRRLADEKRNVIYKNYQDAREDYHKGNVERGGVNELLKGIS